MKRSIATDPNATVSATDGTPSTKSYRLRGPAKRSTSTKQQNSMAKKSGSTNEKCATVAGHNSVPSSESSGTSQPRRSSLRLGLRSRSSSSPSSNVVDHGGSGGQNARRAKQTTLNNNNGGHSSPTPQTPQLPSSQSSSSPVPSSSITKSKKIIKHKTPANADDATATAATATVTDHDNGSRKVRVPKTQSIFRSKKITGVGKKNAINDHNNTHNNNDHGNDNDNDNDTDNSVVVVNSVGQNPNANQNHDTASSIDDDDDDDKTVISKKSSSSTTKSKPSTKATNRVRTKRRYICTYCNKEFLGGNDLRKHIRIHTDERPFECQHCGQRFRQGGCLKNHIASQHGTSETFICYYCNKSFPIKERLRLHMRLHSGEKVRFSMHFSYLFEKMSYK